MKPKKTRLAKKLDTLWSEVVKIKANYKCEYCHTSKTLNSHHIYSRSKKSTRWEPENGVSLCVAHHTFSSGFSAHKTPTEFVDWLKEHRGLQEYDRLRRFSNQIKKWTIGEMEERIKTFELIIDTYNGGV